MYQIRYYLRFINHSKTGGTCINYGKKNMKKKAYLTAQMSLEIVKNRLNEIGIEVDISVVREGTPGEYQEIVIRDGNLDLALADLMRIRKMTNGLASDLHIEVGSTNTYAVLEIRPRYSYLLESEMAVIE